MGDKLATALRIARATGGSVERHPTDAQKEAGNYRKEHIAFHGLQIAIENKKGATRSGTGPTGRRWSCVLPADYGYIKGTEGADGDHVDCYVGPHRDSHIVFVVDQKDPRTGKFDEHKCLLGFRNEDEARKIYDAGFSDNSGPRRRGHMTTMSLGAFKNWLRAGHTKKPLGEQREARAEGGGVRGLKPVEGEPDFFHNPLPHDVDAWTALHVGKTQRESREKMERMWAAHKAAKEVDLPIARLTGIEDKIGKRALANPGHELPFVEHSGGRYFVRDGNHRVVAAHLKGAKHIRAKLANLDNPHDHTIREARAEGGSVTEKVHTGPIHSAVAGRTDHLPMHVPSGSYVIPADIVSSFGEGNTIAGFKAMRRMFGGVPYQNKPMPYEQGETPYNEPLPRAAGGETGHVPIVAAGGEYVLTPEQVRLVGDGDLDTGHRVLDEFIKRSRKDLISTLRKLPGPKKS